MFLVRAVHLVRQLHRRRRNIHEVELGAQGLHHAPILVQIPCEDSFPQCRDAMSEYQAASQEVRQLGIFVNPGVQHNEGHDPVQCALAREVAGGDTAPGLGGGETHSR